MKKNAKSKRPEAERAGEHYARAIEGCVATVRAVRTKWQRQDLFASDIVGKRKDGTHVYAQVTAGQSEAVRTRRRKLDAIPWHESDTVLLLQLVQTDNPANARGKLWFFRVHKYCAPHRYSEDGPRQWGVEDEACQVPKDWFKSYKETHKRPTNHIVNHF